MNMRHTLLGLLVALLYCFGTGCEKSGIESAATFGPTKLSNGTIIRVHWVGKNELGSMASAFYFMRVWDLSQSAQLEVQTLRKLSTMPWRLGQREETATNETSARLFRLWADLVWNESYFEIYQATNQPVEFVLAIRLNASHEGLWRTNLAAVVASLTGLRPIPAPDGHFGWSLQRQGSPTHIKLSRVGQWTVFSAGPDNNGLLDTVAARIRREHTPYIPRRTGDWLEADVDLQRLKAWLPHDWQLPADLPAISLAVTGDRAHVLTHAILTFPKPLHLPLQRWNIPTNLIHQPLIAFTAARGFKPWLASWEDWKKLQIGSPPDQVYSWALPAGLAQTYFAVPTADAAGQMRALTAHLLNKANPWLRARGYVGFRTGESANGITWGNSPSIKPFIKSTGIHGAGGVVYGGLIPETNPDTPTNLFYYHPSFPELLSKISSQTNLVYYHWELTGARIHSCLYISQFLSIISRRAPLPLDSVSAVWLKTVMPRLGNCTTTVRYTGTNQLSFTRKSTLGFTAAELNLLAVWLQSPHFPDGL